MADADTPDVVGDERDRAEQRLRARQAMQDAADERRQYGALRHARAAVGRSGLLGTVGLLAAFYFFFMRGRGAGASWRSYYLFWIGVPVAIALLVVSPGDPDRGHRRAGRAPVAPRSVSRSSSTQPGAFAGGRTHDQSRQRDGAPRSREDLARETSPAARAAAARGGRCARDPGSLELLYLSGVSTCWRGTTEALEELLAVIHREPGFHYGEAYLRAGGRVIGARALGRRRPRTGALHQDQQLQPRRASTSACACARRARTPTVRARRATIYATCGGRCRRSSGATARLVHALVVRL